MPRRHSQLIDLRNKFLAHSSAEGTRVIVFPPGVENPLAQKPKARFDFNIGKRVFPSVEFVKWLRVASSTFKNRLHSDIGQLLTDSFGGDSGLDKPFELKTGHEDFEWTPA